MCLAAAGSFDEALAAFARAGTAVADDMDALFARAWPTASAAIGRKPYPISAK